MKKRASTNPNLRTLPRHRRPPDPPARRAPAGYSQWDTALLQLPTNPLTIRRTIGRPTGTPSHSSTTQPRTTHDPHPNDLVTSHTATASAANDYGHPIAPPDTSPRSSASACLGRVHRRRPRTGDAGSVRPRPRGCSTASSDDRRISSDLIDTAHVQRAPRPSPAPGAPRSADPRRRSPSPDPTE